jgi:hypothetical protein
MGLREILGAFPNTAPGSVELTSPPSPRYNCIAWAAGDPSRWWWPLEPDYWPEAAPRAPTLAAFQFAFATLGYVVCGDDTLAPALEKIAIFVGADGPTHAAKQTEDGKWSSKLGRLEDIRHELQALEGRLYGSVALIMSRPRVW